MTRVALSGGSGFVGANLTRRLIDEGHEVFLLLRPGARRWRLDLVPEAVRVVADLGDQDSVERAINGIRPNWVFHLATYGAYPGQTDLRSMVRANLNGAINLLEAAIAAGAQVFVNTGSSSEYGHKDHPPAENESLEPNSHYAWTKAAATHYCSFTASRYDIRIPTLRLYSVYGPYEEPGRLVPTLVFCGLRGKLPPLVNPSTARDFVHIDDVCDAYLLAAGSSTGQTGPVYNVGSGVQTTMAQIVELVRRRLNIAEEPAWATMAPRSWDTDTWVSNNRKITTELGWSPQVSLEQGLDRLAFWFERHPKLHERYS
ncbi:MAG: NAD-dependent epimerase/dehydratase family protein [Actinomycetota bacterium]